MSTGGRSLEAGMKSPTVNDQSLNSTLGSSFAHGVGAEGEMTLRLHGDISRATVPHLHAVLDGVLLLQPGLLKIDLADVSRVSVEVLEMISCFAFESDNVEFHSPSPKINAELVRVQEALSIATR
jgi:hypothetical protein